MTTRATRRRPDGSRYRNSPQSGRCRRLHPARRAHEEERRLDQAIRDYTEAIRLDPNSSIAYFNRAISLDDKDETTRAIADLDQSLRLDPSFLRGYNFRGSLHRKNNDLERARADYNVVLASKDPASEGLRQTARERLAALPSSR